MKRSTWAVLALASILLAGCSAEPTSESVSDTNPDTAGVTGPVVEMPAAQSQQVDVQLKSWDEVQQWVAEQQGKVVVIDVWSTFCTTCMREFPGFVALNQKHPDQLAGASLSVDYYGGPGSSPDEVVPRVRKFLESQNATMANFVSTDPDESVLKEVGVSAIPIALVYDRQGKLHKLFTNDNNEYGPTGFTYEAHIEPVVEQLLAAE